MYATDYDYRYHRTGRYMYSSNLQMNWTDNLINIYIGNDVVYFGYFSFVSPDE